MKNRHLLFITFFVLLLLALGSCEYCGDDREIYFTRRIISVNLDGSEQYIYGYEEGFIVPMHDSQRFLCCNEDLTMREIGTQSKDVYLQDIKIDDNYDGMETIGLSNDDNYIAFTSYQELYCLDLSTGDYTQLTIDFYDNMPQFGVDDRIYFSRKDTENDNYKLMSIEKDGSSILEICDSDKVITHIFPGKVDSNVVFYINNNSKFNKVLLDEEESAVLCELPKEMRITARTNDDRYFSFSANYNHHYIFDTYLNSIKPFLYPPFSNGVVAKIFPNQNLVLTKSKRNEVKLKIWDIGNEIQIGEDIVIEKTMDFGHSSFCITPDEEKAIIIHYYIISG